jgi:hypothetical protein
MRSRRGLIAAALVVGSYLAAVAVGLLGGAGTSTIVHFVMGTGLVLFAASVVDFGLPRWVNIPGAAAAAALGAIFLMQGIAEVTGSEGVRYVAFDVLGHQLERFLPDVIYLWFVALLLLASRGKTRILGWVVMLIVVGYELASLVTFLLGIPMLNLNVIVLLLPFVWLLFESAKRRPAPAAVVPDTVVPAGSRPAW